MGLPELMEHGGLLAGVHSATLDEVAARFLAFGSFITRKTEPNDVDIFMVMNDRFDIATLPAVPKYRSGHPARGTSSGSGYSGGRRLAVLGGEQAAIEEWRLVRDGTYRRVVETLED